MTEFEAWLLAYLIFTSALAHAWTIYRWRERRKHYRRSKAAKKAAATRKKNGTGSRKPAFTSDPVPSPQPQPKETPAVKRERQVTAESAWFQLLDEGDEGEAPDYNELDPKMLAKGWKVRRFNGGASEYAHRDDPDATVQE